MHAEYFAWMLPSMGSTNNNARQIMAKHAEEGG
jgi:hypothetical protein